MVELNDKKKKRLFRLVYKINIFGALHSGLVRLIWGQKVVGSSPTAPKTSGYALMVNGLPSKQRIWVRFPLPTNKNLNVFLY